MARPERRQALPACLGLLAIVLALVVPVTSAAQDEPTDDDLEARLERVNDGTLHFLSSPPGKPVHHHHNEVRIEVRSLEDGWVRLEQCHEHLDAVPLSQVVFREDRVRNLSVASAFGIERVWVEGPSVQLAGVTPGARLCIGADSRSLSREDDGHYLVRNGPFMRRFLDGYYPMWVTMTVRYPCDRLRFVGATPSPQAGFTVGEGACRVDLDASFEGRLYTELRFEPLSVTP